MVEHYLDYKTHVFRQVYSTDSHDLEEQLDKHETAWPEYKDSSVLVAVPSYVQVSYKETVNLHNADELAVNVIDGQKWLDA